MLLASKHQEKVFLVKDLISEEKVELCQSGLGTCFGFVLFQV